MLFVTKNLYRTVFFFVVTSVCLFTTVGFGRPADSASSLKGEVKFEGTAPKPARIDMSADPLCAKAHPTPLTTEDVVVGTGGGLENVIVYVSDGLTSHDFQPPQDAVTLEQKGCQYQPHVVAMQANQKLN